MTVEIPKGSRNKYEYDPDLKCIKLDRIKDLEMKKTGVTGWRDADAAWSVIRAARENRQNQAGPGAEPLTAAS